MKHRPENAAVTFMLSSLILFCIGCADGEVAPVQQVQWDFQEAGWALAEAKGCTAEVRDGRLYVDIEKGDVQLVFPSVNMNGPVRVQFQMKSGDGAFGEVEIYWRQHPDDAWQDTRMVKLPAAHDEQWHEFEAVLPTVGAIKQIRIDPGYKPGKAAFDWVRLTRQSLPTQIAAQRASLPEGFVLRDAALDVQFICQTASFAVTDRRTGRVWTSAGYADKSILIGAEQPDEKTLRLTLWDVFTQSDYYCVVRLEQEGVLSFELDAEKPAYEKPFFALNTFPPHLRTDFEAGKLIFCTRSSGNYIDQTDDHPHWQEMPVYGNLSMDMPWIGVMDEDTGEGLMVLVESPADAHIVMEQDASGRNWPHLYWLASMDTFRYPRRLSYRFSPNGGYLSLAEMYRQYAQETGKLLTLEEKADRKPNTRLLKGAPKLWGAIDAWDFIREARTRGIRRGILSNAHQGLRDTRTLRWINEMGYITNEYENVSDFLEGPTGFLSDCPETAAFHYRPGLGPAKGWLAADGTQYYSRSTGMALQAIKTYAPQRLEKYGFNGRFVDVTAALGLFEDYHPDRTFDRRQDIRHRRDVFEYLDDKGLILGMEHGNDWAVDLVEYTEGSTGGPFWWDGGWSAGELKKPTHRDQIKQQYIKYGMGYDIRIPMWQLVYHDCVIDTWYWGDNAGFMYEAMPELSDRKDLFNILYGTIPLFWRDDWGYGWIKNRFRFLQTYHETCNLHAAIAFDRMLNHEFLSEDRAVQRTTFCSGTVVVVNFGQTPREYLPDGEHTPITLAPSGFYARGPQIYQSRLVEDGGVVTRIETDGYLRVQTDRDRAVGPVELSGVVTAFDLPKDPWHIPQDRWHILLEKTERCAIDVESLLGLWPDQPFLIYDVDTFGRLVKTSTIQRTGGRVVFYPEQAEAIYAVVAVQPEDVIIAPQRDISSDETVELTAADDSLLIRYTTDGSEPTADSKLYDKPFQILSGCVVTARAFQPDGTPAGDVAQQAYRVIDLLYESPILEGSGNVQTVDVDIADYTGLLLDIDQSGTNPYSDHVSWGQARLIASPDETVFLSSLAPSRALHDHYPIGYDVRMAAEDASAQAPLLLGGRHYEKGLGMMSPGKLEYDFDRPYTRFKSAVGIDDSMADRGRVVVRVYGIR